MIITGPAEANFKWIQLESDGALTSRRRLVLHFWISPTSSPGLLPAFRAYFKAFWCPFFSILLAVIISWPIRSNTFVRSINLDRCIIRNNVNTLLLLFFIEIYFQSTSIPEAILSYPPPAQQREIYIVVPNARADKT